MPKVKTLIPHARRVGIGIWRNGEVYDEDSMAAQEKVRAGFVEYVMETKEDTTIYRSAPAPVLKEEPAPLTLVSKKGSWYFFSDGEKVIGKLSAAEYLGVSVEELEAMNVDLNDN